MAGVAIGPDFPYDLLYRQQVKWVTELKFPSNMPAAFERVNIQYSKDGAEDCACRSI